jgi:GAF domain-containing protein
VEKDVLDAVLTLSNQLNRQAFARPPIEGWLDSFLQALCDRFTRASLRGVRVARVVGNTAIEIGRAGASLPQAADHYDLSVTPALADVIRSRRVMPVQGGRAYPIAKGSEGIGVLLAAIDQPDAMVEEALAALALQLGPALTQDTSVPGPQTGALNSQIAMLRTLHEITQSMSAALDTREVMSRAARSLVEMLRVDHVGIVMFDSTRRAGEVVAEYPDNGIAGLKVPVSPEIYEEMARERQPIAIARIEDVANYGLDRAVFDAQGIRSIGFVPIFVQNELVGSVGFDIYYNEREFTGEELESAAAITAQLGISIHNAQLYSELRRQAEQRQHLAELSHRITSTFDRNTILQIADEETRKLIETDQVSVALRRADEALLQLFVLGEGEPALTEFEAIQTALNLVCESPEPLVLEDISGSQYPDYHLLAQSGVCSAVIMPLVVGGQTIGTYNVMHRQPGFYTPASLDVLEQIANQVAVALENARQYAETVKRAETELLMNRLSATIQGRGTLQEVLLSTVQEMAEALGARRARVRLQVPPASMTDSSPKVASLSKLADKLSEKREN